MRETRMGRRLWAQPYVLLCLTMLMWGGNAIAGRLAVGEVSPMVITFGRWFIAGSALLLFARREILAEVRGLSPYWRRIALMGVMGFTGFNALFYESAHHTTAVNLTILQGSIPVFVLLGALLIYRTPVAPLQYVGMVVTTLGVLVLASRGELSVLLGLEFNIGDVWMLIACVLYAGYTLGLRKRPPVSGLTLFAAFASVAIVTALPLVAVEAARGELQLPSWKGLLIVAYVGFFPSLLSQLFFMRGVELIGPGRAGLFVNLVPVFGAFLAVVILSEPFGLHSAVALALVIGGIYVAERVGKR
jgi:drug/metabolite transporter (DMT)-like permease